MLILQIILISAAAWIIISFPWNDFLFLVRAVVLTGMNPLWPPQPRKLINYAAYRVTVLFAGIPGAVKLPYSPVNVVISITARCNKKCGFCYFKDQLNPPDAARLELSLEQFEKFLDHPLVSRALRINLTGGEPLLNKDLFFMIRAARKRGHIINVVTNGLLLEKRALELLESPPNILAVSFYPEDREQVIRGLELLAGKIPVNLRFVLSRERMGDLSTLFQTAIDYSVKMVCIEHIYASAGHPLDGSTSVPVGDEQFENLKTFIQHKYGRSLLISWGPLSGSWKAGKAPKCRVFRHSIHLDALGRVSPCCLWPMENYHGDVFTDNHAWNSPVLQNLRRQMAVANPPELCKLCAYLDKDYLGI